MTTLSERLRLAAGEQGGGPAAQVAVPVVAKAPPPKERKITALPTPTVVGAAAAVWAGAVLVGWLVVCFGIAARKFRWQ